MFGSHFRIASLQRRHVRRTDPKKPVPRRAPVPQNMEIRIATPLDRIRTNVLLYGQAARSARTRAWAATDLARAGSPSSTPGAGSRLCRASRSIPPPNRLPPIHISYCHASPNPSFRACRGTSRSPQSGLGLETRLRTSSRSPGGTSFLERGHFSAARSCPYDFPGPWTLDPGPWTLDPITQPAAYRVLPAACSYNKCGNLS